MSMNVRGSFGFTVIEMLISAALSMAVMGAILAVTSTTQAALRAQGEAADLHQRLRAATDLLAADLRAAESVRPYRVGGTRDDGAAGVYYRGDTITVLGVPTAPLSADADAMRTYYLKSDPLSRAFELIQYDGRRTDLPVVEHVVKMVFDYFGDPQQPGAALLRLEPSILTDGPWSEDASHRRFDLDLLRIREVHVRLRLESTSAFQGGVVPDEEVELHVALRNRKAEP